MIPWATLLLADWWDDRSPRERLMLLGLALIASLLAGAAVIWVADRWRRRSAMGVARAEQQMSTFRELYEQGVLSREEYDRIRGKLGARMLPASQTKPPTEEPSKPPAAQEPGKTPPASAEPPGGAGTSPT